MISLKHIRRYVRGQSCQMQEDQAHTPEETRKYEQKRILQLEISNKQALKRLAENFISRINTTSSIKKLLAIFVLNFMFEERQNLVL